MRVICTHLLEYEGTESYLEQIVDADDLVQVEGGSLLHVAGSVLHEVQVDDHEDHTGPWRAHEEPVITPVICRGHRATPNIQLV